MIEILAENL